MISDCEVYILYILYVRSIYKKLRNDEPDGQFFKQLFSLGVYENIHSEEHDKYIFF